jgi:hypothetical protein
MWWLPIFVVCWFVFIWTCGWFIDSDIRENRKAMRKKAAFILSDEYKGPPGWYCKKQLDKLVQEQKSKNTL